MKRRRRDKQVEEPVIRNDDNEFVLMPDEDMKPTDETQGCARWTVPLPGSGNAKPAPQEQVMEDFIPEGLTPESFLPDDFEVKNFIPEGAIPDSFFESGGKPVKMQEAPETDVPASDAVTAEPTLESVIGEPVSFDAAGEPLPVFVAEPVAFEESEKAVPAAEEVVEAAAPVVEEVVEETAPVVEEVVPPQPVLTPLEEFCILVDGIESEKPELTPAEIWESIKPDDPPIRPKDPPAEEPFAEKPVKLNRRNKQAEASDPPLAAEEAAMQEQPLTEEQTVAEEQPVAEEPQKKPGFLERSRASLNKTFRIRPKTPKAPEYAENQTFEEPAGEAVREKKSFAEAVMRPVIVLLSMIGERLGESKSFFAAPEPAEDETSCPEVSLHEAYIFYEAHSANIRARMRLAILPTLLLCYISFGLPVFGALRVLRVSSAVCVILLLSVMLIGLDVLVSGLRVMSEKRFNANSLVAISCIFSVIDGFFVCLGISTKGLPFCAVSALTMFLTLLGSLFNCEANMISFRTADTKERHYTLSADVKEGAKEATLVKSRRRLKGFVSCTEEAGPDELAFTELAPILIPAGLLMAVIAVIASRGWSDCFHALAGIFVFAAPSAMLLSFSLPFLLSAKKLEKSKACIAGWSGLNDVGRTENIMVTDRDLFSPQDVSIVQHVVLVGFDPVDAISLTASVIKASGSCMTPAFRRLLDGVGGQLVTPDSFSCHDSGGLVAIIGDREVICGSSAFMHLMGVKLAQRVRGDNFVYVAVNRTLAAYFQLEYTAHDDVRDSILNMLKTSRSPIFATRDFNISPTMLQRQFNIHTDGFYFPPPAERYRISAAKPTEYTRPAAVLAGDGLNAYVELAEHGRKLYNLVTLGNRINILAAVIGMIVMTALLITGGRATVGFALLYMLLTMLPAGIMSFVFSSKRKNS